MLLPTTLLILASLLAPVQSSAVKGSKQPQQQDYQQQYKSPVFDRQAKSVAGHPIAQSSPILESSKKVYNDESIRRSAIAQAAAPVEQQQQSKSSVVAAAEQPAVPVPQASPSVVQPVASAPARPPMVVAPVNSVPVEHSATPSVVHKVEQPPVVAPVQPAAPVAAVQAPAVIEPKSAPVEPMPIQPPVMMPAKPADELPPQSDRSAPIREPVVSPVVVQAMPQQQSPVVNQPVVPPRPQVQPEQVVVPIVPVQPQAAAPNVPQQQPQSVVVVDQAPLEAKKDEQSASGEQAPIEVPAPDPGLVLSEPIDSTTKLLIDLDEHVQKFLPAEDKQEPAQPAKESVLVSGVDYSPAQQSPSYAAPTGKSSVPLVPYSSVVGSEHEPIVPPLPSLEKVEKATGVVESSPSSPASSAAVAGSGSQTQSATRQASGNNHNHQNQLQVITQLLDQLDSLQNRIQDTINQLVARRRYVMSALLRPMGTYVRRVRTNLERLQNRINQLQAAAVSVGGNNNGQNRPGGFVDAAAIETIRRRIDDISKRISDIVNRIRFSLTPTSAPLNNNGRK